VGPGGKAEDLRDDAQAAPNIVFILADDLGYGDVGALNASSRIPTPNIDRLAAEGMTFTDAHAPAAVCSPTRYALLTGRYTWRSRLKSGVLWVNSPPLIEPGRPTVATVLKRAGYRTGGVGKWHLGLGYARDENGKIDYARPLDDGPTTHGFDTYFGIPASLDMEPYFYIADDRIVEPPTAEQKGFPFPAFIRKGPRSPDFSPIDCLDRLTASAVDFIAAAEDDRPFFLYFPLSAPHKPVLPHARFVGSTELGPYGDFVVQVDATVGAVLDALDEHGLSENTLVIFSSDNGSFMNRRSADSGPDHTEDPRVQAFRETNHTANGIFRGTKADVWEGGHHVPLLARWPAAVEAGTSSDQTVCLVDTFATLAALAGEPVGADVAEDSFDLSPLLLGLASEVPRAPVVNHSSMGVFAIRDGPYKLVCGNGSGGREKPRGKPFERPYMLFNLAADPSETTDIAPEHPEIVARMEAALEGIRSTGRSRPLPATDSSL
jgi:arylsulfatase A-like enzyme